MEENYSAPGYVPLWVLCSLCLLWIEIHVLLSKGRGLAGGRTGLQSDSPKLRHNVWCLMMEVLLVLFTGQSRFARNNSIMYSKQRW